MMNKSFRTSLAAALVASTALAALPAQAQPGAADATAGEGAGEFVLAVLAVLAGEGAAGRAPGYRHPQDFARPSPDRPFYQPGKGALPRP